jgi:CRISPR/Cas system-associated exonuclease Cas4 (RecB family)
VTTKPILSIDDLKDASSTDLRAAVSALRIKERVLDRISVMGRKEGMTRAEYIAHVESLEEHDCPTCNGKGKVKPRKPREIGCVHPSAAHKCLLRNYYDVTGEMRAKEEIDWKFQATFAIGHAIHGLIQTALELELGAEQFQPEAKVNMGLVRGNTDGDIWLPTVHAILEIKTIGSEYDRLSQPKDDHQLQANGLYATGLDGPFVVFLYVSKMFPYPIKEFVVEHDPGIFKRWLRDKGEKIQRALERGEPPIADAQASECRECPYAHSCPQKLEKKGGFSSKVGGR